MFTHGDLQVDHVFVAGDEVTGVIDWSEASQSDALFDLATGMLLSVAPAPLRSHEMSRCAVATAGMAPGDIALGDRGFCSFAHLATLLNRKQHGVFRAHQRQIIDFTPGRPGGPGSKRKRPNAVIRPSSRWVRSPRAGS